MDHVSKIEIDRGYKTFCCEEHAKQYADSINSNKNKKFSKSEQKQTFGESNE